MSKLYVFGIGGTGSRVLRALTMLLACGVKCKSDTIVPIIIDPDDSAADKTRTVEAMKKYESIRNKLKFPDANNNRFFFTKIRSVVGMENFGFPLNNTRDCYFKDFMKIEELDKSSRALVNLLFSQKNLDSDMKVGFKGNPNIGSIVLNQFSNSQHYKDFANDFKEGDRIFIISSIFGGTGASGFPLLLKTLRSDQSSQSWNLISNAKIGAVTVMPYFKVRQDDNSGVDSSTFISKTKAALAYYENNISKNGSVNALFYIGDNIPASYENHDGGSEQRNNAHIVELCSALAILKFAGMDDTELTEDTKHFEYGLDTDNEDITAILFNNLGHNTKNSIQIPMTQFILMHKYIKNKLVDEYLHQPWAIDSKLDKAFFTGDFYSDVTKFTSYYEEWLEEMNDNTRSFNPFNISKRKPLFDLINGRKSIGAYSIIPPTTNYALFDNRLNSKFKGWNKAASCEEKFMETFYRATDKMVKDIYKL